jgi:hypothetical protein
MHAKVLFLVASTWLSLIFTLFVYSSNMLTRYMTDHILQTVDGI